MDNLIYREMYLEEYEKYISSVQELTPMKCKPFLDSLNTTYIQNHPEWETDYPVEIVIQNEKYPSAASFLRKKMYNVMGQDEFKKKLKENHPVNDLYDLGKDTLMKMIQREKFQQHPKLLADLKKTGSSKILTKNKNDFFGYPANTLGKVLMEMREEWFGFPVPTSPPENNLLYTTTKNSYIAFGDPDHETEKRLAELARDSRITLSGKWIIPRVLKTNFKKLMFRTYSPCEQVNLLIKQWTKKNLNHILEMAQIFSRFRHSEKSSKKKIKDEPLEAVDVLFVLKDVYNLKEEIQFDQKATDEFAGMVEKRSKISSSGLNLLYSIFVKEWERFEDVTSIYEFKQAIQVPCYRSEILFFEMFSRIYSLLKRMTEKRHKACIVALTMLIGKKGMETVKSYYNSELRDFDLQEMGLFYDVLGEPFSQRSYRVLFTCMEYVKKMNDADYVRGYCEKYWRILHKVRKDLEFI